MYKCLILCIALIFSVITLKAIEPKDIMVVEKPAYQISIKHGDSIIGTIKIQLFPDVAPQHCRNFDSLVSIGFYNGTAFHRVIPKFMIQGGDPNSRDKDKSTWGYGDPSQRKIPAEFSSLHHVRGTLSAARASDINSATSQFFICVVPYPSLDGNYTIYGEVLEGMDVVDYIVNVPRDSKDNPLVKVEMNIIKLNPDEVLDNVDVNNITIVYPNPANSIININGSVQSNSSYEILNILGESMQSGLINGKNVDISNLSSGTYLLKTNKSTTKFMVIR